MIFRVCGQGFGFLVRFLRFVARVWVFGCDFRGLVIDQGLGFSIHWLGFRVYAFSFVFCGREHKNNWKNMKNSEKKSSKNGLFEIFIPAFGQSEYHFVKRS